MAKGPLGNVLEYLRKLATAQTASQQTDSALLERFVCHQDEAAFAVLVERHGSMVLAVCWRVLKQAQDAEDAWQATFLVLARKAASIRNQESLASWLYGVAYRVARKLKQAVARRDAVVSLVVDVPQVDTTIEVNWRELRAVLDEELQRLPDKYRAPLVLCYLEGKTRGEAAQQLGWTDGVLRGRLERGRERLQARLTRRGFSLTSSLLATLLAQEAGATGVPAPLLVVMVKAASAFAAGKAAAVVSPAVAALVEGVLQTMFVTKLKTIGAAVFVVSLLAMGAGGLAFQAPKADPKPEKNTPQPQGAVKDEDRLTALLKARVQAAELELEVRMKEFLAGRGTLDVLLGASRRHVEAYRELHPKPADHLIAAESHFRRMKDVHEINENRYQAGRIPISDLKETEYYRLEAEIWLERLKPKRLE